LEYAWAGCVLSWACTPSATRHPRDNKMADNRNGMANLVSSSKAVQKTPSLLTKMAGKSNRIVGFPRRKPALSGNNMNKL